MITKTLPLIFILFSLLACSSDKKVKVEEETKKDEFSETAVTEIMETEGYELMVQKCFICHFAKPDPSKKDEMIAPPMLRVQEHYKPSYTDKDEFIAAIIEWINNPSEEKTLMPGAVRKFKLMPILPYEEADLKLIAGVLYDIDFGEMPRMHKGRNNGLQLKDGKKWKLNAAHIEQVKSIIGQLENFESAELASYNQLGRTVFDNAKTLLLDKTYGDDLFEELHNFFNGIEGHIHLLIAAQSIDEAKNQLGLLKTKFAEFDTYFE